MYYVCIENNLIISILNYQPSVPDSVRIIEISDDDYKKITDQTHFFNIDTETTEAYPNAFFEEKDRDLKNAEHREFLNSTDWMVLRHIREKALGIDTTLTDEQYLELEGRRQSIANSII